MVPEGSPNQIPPSSKVNRWNTAWLVSVDAHEVIGSKEFAGALRGQGALPRGWRAKQPQHLNQALDGDITKKNGIWYHSSCYFMAILICKKIVIEWFVVLDGENGSFTQLIHGHFVGENYHLSQDTSRDAKRKYWNKESELDDLNIQNEQCSKPATLFLSTACF